MSDPTLPADWIAVDWGTSRMRAWAFGPDGAEIGHAVNLLTELRAKVLG